jgi:integrase
MGYGSGTLFQRGKKGIWYYQAWVDGKQFGPFSSGSTNRKDAQLELDKLIGKRARGEISVSPRDITIGVLLEHYLQYAQSELAPGTIAEYRSHITHQLNPAFGRLKPEKLTHQHLTRYRDRREGESVKKFRKNGSPIVVDGETIKPSTINRELSVLRAALNYALETDKRLMFRIPPFPIVREKNVRKGFQTEAKFERLYAKLPYAGLRALAACSFYTGVRKGELRKVDWPDVDFDHGIITLYDTKNDRAREVPIFDGLMRESLREARAERDECWPECSAVFAYNGRRLGDPKRAWKTAVEATGHSDLLFHDMRRSANRNMRDLGVPQPIRMAIMGHDTPSMDIRYGIVDRTNLDVVKELHRRKAEEKTTAKTTARSKKGKAKSA